MPILSAGCCGSTLKRSATIVAWILLALAILQLILAQVYFYYILEHTAFMYVYEPPIDVFSLAIANILVNSLLLYGLRNDARMYLWPWMVFTTMEMILGLGLINQFLFVTIFYGEPGHLAYVVVFSIIFLLFGYMFALVASQYQLLRDQFKNEPITI